VASNVSAGVIVIPGPGGGNPAENLLFNQPGLELGPALTIQGATNQSNAVLDIMSINDMLLVGNGGQARVEGDGGASFTGVMFIPSSNPPVGLNGMVSFTDIKFNIDASADGTLLIDVFLNGSNTATSFGPFDLDENGENFFLIISFGGDVITKVTLTASGDIIEQIRQIRLGGVETSNGNGEIPEPGALSLWAVVGIAGALGFAGRKLRRKLAMART
jgi:hypothetical protein